MKKLAFFFYANLLGWCFSNIYAQVTVDYLVSQEPIFSECYTTDKSMNGVRVKMQFSGDSVLNPGVIGRLKGKNILRVDMVYTDYRTEKTFDQPGLNSRRLKKLLKLCPEAFANSAIQWNFIAQTSCKNPETCSELFHGFVIYYMETPSEESIKKEIEKFDCTFKTIKIIDTIRTHRVLTKVYYQPWSLEKREAGILYDSRSIWLRKEIKVKDSIKLKRPRTRTHFISVYDSNCYLKNNDTIKLVSSTFIWGFNDSTVTTVLNRNKDWKDMVVAIDVTGSMSPYTEQLIKWIALQTNLEKVKSFTFFNDGDNMNDHLKKIGKTGGIYHCTKNEFTAVVHAARFAMAKGGGGDGPENDVEAMIGILKNNKKVKEIILIADNLANMRDFKLISEINVPVRVILCGSAWGVNTQYLKLARTTGGSVHTIEEDITSLATLQEGERIKIGKQHFRISGGEFVLE